MRFTIVGFLAAHYGPEIVQFSSKYYKPTLYALIGPAVAGGTGGLWAYLRYRRKRKEEKPSRPARKLPGAKPQGSLIGAKLAEAICLG